MSTAAIPINDKKTIRAWAFFDWANSAYMLVISTAVFPIYFSSVTPDRVMIFGGSITKTALYSFAVSFSYILVAITSPLLSGIADYGGKRLLFLKIFTTVGAISCMALFLFKDADWVWFGTAAFIIASLGFAGGIVFYNSYLPLIATEDRYDTVSAKGYAYGYVGSVILLVVILAMIQKPEWFNISKDGLAPRIGFLMVGMWWLGFAQITFRKMPADKKGKLPDGIVKKGFNEMKKVFHFIKGEKNIRRFLMSFFFYTAGVNTVIYLATIFAEQELGFETAELILIVLILQLVAVIGAYLFAYVSKLKGNKFALGIQIIIWMLICFAAYYVTDKNLFYALAAMVGMVLGGIQSLSRSSYSKMLTDDIDDLSSFFSFYDVLYKLAVVAGTFIFGLVELLTNNMRYSVLSLAILFLIGFLILMSIDFGHFEKGKGRKVVG